MRIPTLIPRYFLQSLFNKLEIQHEVTIQSNVSSRFLFCSPLFGNHFLRKAKPVTENPIVDQTRSLHKRNPAKKT